MFSCVNRLNLDEHTVRVADFVKRRAIFCILINPKSYQFDAHFWMFYECVEQAMYFYDNPTPFIPSQAREAEANACLLSQQPILLVHPGHRAHQHLQQRRLSEQHYAEQLRQHQLQPELCSDQHVCFKITVFCPVSCQRPPFHRVV